MGRHGLSTHPVYSIWRGMHTRCYKERCRFFADYGGRGIAICDEWHDVRKFVEWAEGAGFAPGLSIERIDVNGNYCPANCTWIPLADQPKNRRNNRFVTYRGERMTVAEASRRTGLSAPLIFRRLNAGWSEPDALRKPRTYVFGGPHSRMHRKRRVKR